MSDRRLTVGVLTYNDYNGLFFTIEAAKLYHPEVLDRLHFTVVDNDPDGPAGNDVRNYVTGIPNADYHAVRGVSATSFRNLVFELARTDYVLCVDSHVLLVPHALDRLLRFYDANPNCHDLLQGPLITERGDVLATHMVPTLNDRNFGVWKMHSTATGVSPTDLERHDPFEIPMHGMGLFACTREGWPRFTSGCRHFSGEEGIIHEKFRLMGRKCWCLPFLQWLHRFGRPGGQPYKNTDIDKLKNHVLGFREVQMDVEPVWDYFTRKMLEMGANDNQLNQWIAGLRQWEKTLPPSGLPTRTEVPFLGIELQVND